LHETDTAEEARQKLLGELIVAGAAQGLSRRSSSELS
jgi:hypothetical protein